MKAPDSLSLSFRRSLHKHRVYISIAMTLLGIQKYACVIALLSRIKYRHKMSGSLVAAPEQPYVPHMGAKRGDAEYLPLTPAEGAHFQLPVPLHQVSPSLAKSACGRLSLPFQGPCWLVTMRLAVLLPIYTDGATRGRWRLDPRLGGRQTGVHTLPVFSLPVCKDQDKLY